MAHPYLRCGLFVVLLLMGSEVSRARRTDMSGLVLGTQPEEATCMKLEAARDAYKAKCYWKWCGGKEELPGKNIDFCEHAKPYFIIDAGFSVSLPVFGVPVSKIGVQLQVDGVMEYQEPMESSVYKSLQVSAGVAFHVHLSLVDIAFGFSGSLKVSCDHCMKFSTLWNSLNALLIHDYFKFVRKSTEETEEVMQTLIDGLRDAEDLVDRSVPGDVLMTQYSVNIEYTGKFFATASGAIKIPKVLDLSRAAEASFESHRMTLVGIGPWGPQVEDATGVSLPTYTMFIHDSGYEKVSIARTALTNNYGGLGVEVRCDSDNSFSLAVSFKSAQADLNASDTSVALWQVSTSKILKDSRLRKGYCIPGMRWGHKRMFDRVAAAKDVFLPLLKSRKATGTEIMTLRVASGSSDMVLSLRRESDLDLPKVLPAISSLISSGVSLHGTTAHLQYKTVS